VSDDGLHIADKTGSSNRIAGPLVDEIVAKQY